MKTISTVQLEQDAPTPRPTLAPGQYVEISATGAREVWYQPNRLDRENTANGVLCLVLIVLVCRALFPARIKRTLSNG